MPNARDYCFTLFLADDEETAFLACQPIDENFPLRHALKYVVYQLERCPATQRLHWQGYIKFSKCVSMQYIKEHFPILAGAHLEKRNGTDAEARDYCTKERTRELGPWENGSWQGQQGKRSDLDSYASRIRELAQEGLDWHDSRKRLADEFPAVHLKFSKHGAAVYEDVKPDPTPVELPQPLQRWEQEVLDIVSRPRDRRAINWVFGETGGEGKSRMALHLITGHRAIMLSGRDQDMALAYAEQPAPVVVFDLPRTAVEHMDHLYSFAEKLKNGVLFSSKYNSRQVIFNPPHVFFFANFEPDSTKWSADRLNLIRC